VILLDADVLLLELSFQRDPRFTVNRQAVQQIQADAVPLAITVQALLEVVGKRSFNVARAQVGAIASQVTTLYRLKVLPDPQQYPEYASCNVDDLISQMGHQMALGDAVQAVQIARFASSATCLLTWNARHFQGKIVIPVLTPEEWLNLRLGRTP
jgi:hypothetical protein